MSLYYWGVIIGFKWTHWLLHRQPPCYTYPGPWQNQIVHIGLGYMYTSRSYQCTTAPRTCTSFSYLLFWKYSLWLPQHSFPLSLIIQNINGKFLWYTIKFQHVTSSIRIPSSCSNVSVLISWINFKTNEFGVDLKCVGCISAEKQWDILWVGVSNWQPDLATVISVGIFDNLQRVSMSTI